MISERAGSINPSMTLGITAVAKRLKKEGKDIVTFGAGEPDFPTPQNIKAAAIKAINDNFTYYTPTSGIDELRQAIAEKLRSYNNVSYEPSEVAVSCGGKHSLYNIMQVLLNPGDEALLKVPYWVSYLEQIKLANAEAKLIQTEKDGTFNIDEMKQKINDKTKMIILNSPSNPAGTVLSQSDLKAIADLVLEHNLWIVSDEVYEAFVYDGLKQVSIAYLSSEIKSRTVISNAFSKTYSMTGWRIGYTAGPKEVIDAIGRLQDHMTSNPTSIAQMAALEALKGSQDSVKKMVDAFDERRKVMVTRLNEMKNIECPMPKGAFYAFPSIKSTGYSSMEFSENLLRDAHTAVIPGIAFGKDTNIRLSYATSLQEIERGMDRIEKFCNT